jgi:hypothetical protein
MGHGRSDLQPEIQLVCTNWHQYEQMMTAEEVLAFRLAVEPEKLLSRPMWLVGANRAMFDDRHMWLW